ncbi:MAG: hypothetical protein ABMA25_02340 [Ilumatobacteraceae bacterium]
MPSRYDPSPEPRDDESDAEFRVRYRPYFDRHSSIGETPGFRQRNWDSVMSFLGVDPGPPQDFRTPMQQLQQPLFD